MNRTGKGAVVVAAVASLFAVVGCENEQESMQSGTVGSNARADQLLVRNVHLAATEDGYQPGQEADTQLSLVNRAHQWDALVDVRSPQAKNVNLRWDRGCDGKAETVERIPVSAQGTVPASAGQPEGATPYYLELVDITQVARPGTTFPLTLTFEKAGDVTVDAKVQATRDGDQPPPRPCQRKGEPTERQPSPMTPPRATTGTAAPSQAREITVSGTVGVRTGTGCRVLTNGSRPYILLEGDPEVLQSGAHVVVRGQPDPSVFTNCGHGVTLRVIDAVPR